MNIIIVSKLKAYLMMLSISLIGLNVSAQQQTLLVHGLGTVIFQRAVSEIDSVIFSQTHSIGLTISTQHDTMYIYRSGTVIFEKEVSDIDSVYFHKTNHSTPLSVTGTLTGSTIQGCSSANAPVAAISVAQLEMMEGGIIIDATCTTKDKLIVSSVDVANGSCPIKIDRIYTVHDVCNNSITIAHGITIQDTTPPVVTGTLSGTTVLGCSAISAVPAATSVQQLEGMTGGITINDVCADKALLSVNSSDIVSGSCPITITRTYSVKDECNNISSIVHIIAIYDITPPVVTGILTGTTVQGSSASVAPTAASTVSQLEAMTGGLTINDDCTAKSLLTVNSVDVVSGSSPITITRTYSVKDACNNSVSIVHVITIKNNPSIVIDLVVIPAGTFIMGSPTNESDRNDNETLHEVTLSAFKMSKYEITNAQYAEFLNARNIGGDGFYAAGMYPGQHLIYASSGSNDFGLHYSGGKWIPAGGFDNHPAIYVTWFGAMEFAKYAGGRLPTESEWEYACRAGSSTPFNTGNCLSDLQAKYDWKYPYQSCTNSKTDMWRTTVVGSFPANAWGLYDMHGNVWEWCSDWLGTYPTSVQTNPTGAATGTYRVPRGGGNSNVAHRCRCANRGEYTPDYYSFTIGLRLVIP